MPPTHAPLPPLRVTASVNRYASLIKVGSGLLIVMSLALMLRRLPVALGIEALQTRIADLGLGGPLVFGLLYVAASLLLVPASALTLAAGAIFGLGVGTLVVSLASTTAAGLAFLSARYFARQRITRKLRHSPRFNALDCAISEGGWKIVALLRLSPALPFTLQNYLYGLTGIRFWPYLLTSWLAMLPGTFLYIYLGHLGRAGVEAASGEPTRTPAEWAMMGVGLLATAVATVYIARLAHKALRQRAVAVEEDAMERNAAHGWPWGATILAIVALVLLAAAVFVNLWPRLLMAERGRDPARQKRSVPHVILGRLPGRRQVKVFLQDLLVGPCCHEELLSDSSRASLKRKRRFLFAYASGSDNSLLALALGSVWQFLRLIG